MKMTTNETTKFFTEASDYIIDEIRAFGSIYYNELVDEFEFTARTSRTLLVIVRDNKAMPVVPYTIERHLKFLHICNDRF